ncbi:MAG: hypothetical protein MI919_32640, partial [Holophagales bacterium]|nr:hypothetical protein [Holophagales bacterium]
PFTVQMEEELADYFHEYFGEKVDIRFGMYEATGDLTRRHEDVARDMADEGLTNMLLTRETTDNNDYANISMTRHWVDYELCRNGLLDEVDIKQVKQIGRTPEYNTMVGTILQQHLERLDPGTDEVALAYVTYGNPWPGTSADLDSAFAVSHPWVNDVYPENAYYNYLSFKRYAEDVFGDTYNLVWTRPGKSGVDGIRVPQRPLRGSR